MTVFTIVQSAANAVVVPIAPGTHEVTVGVSLAGVTAGNMLIAVAAVHCNAANNTGIAVPATFDAIITDDHFSPGWTRAEWIEGGVQVCGVGEWYLPNVAAGGYGVTLSVKVPNANPIFTLDQIPSIILLEVALLTSPVVEDTASQRNGTAAPSMDLTVTDSQGDMITSGFNHPNQKSGVVVDFSNILGDLLIAGLSGDIVGIPVPTVTPPSFTYTLINTASISGTEYLNVWTGDIEAPPPPPLPPIITCGSPPDGVEGVAYTHTFPVTDGTAPFTFAITAGVLPPGITLDNSTGIVSGTPTTPGTYPFTIQVTDSLLAASHVDCAITINSDLAIICDNPPSGIVGRDYSHFFPASGGIPPYTFALVAGAFPDGLTLNTATGELSGVPLVPGPFTFTIQVTDSIAATATVTCSITILTVPNLRLTYVDASLYFDYLDNSLISTAPSTFEIDTTGGFWPHKYVNPVITHYWEETQTGVTPEMLMGTTDGFILRSGGITDAAQELRPIIRTPSYDFDDPRALKLFMDMMTDVDPSGGYSLTLGFDNYSILTTPVIQAPSGGRIQILNSLSSPLAAGLTLNKNIAAEYAFLPGTVLYEFEPSFYFQPFLSRFYTTQLMDHNIPGWKQLRFARIAVISVSPVTFQVLNDDGVSIAVSIVPSTDGVLKNYFVQLPNAAKGRLLRYTASAAADFVLFTDRTLVRIKKWGGPQFLEVRPFLQ